MAGPSTVLEDSSLLSRLDRALLPVESFMAFLSGLAAFSLMFLAAYSVTGREFFEKPLLGYVDLIEILMPLLSQARGLLPLMIGQCEEHAQCPLGDYWLDQE